MKKIIVATLILFFVIISVSAQQDWKKNKIKVKPPVCYASGKVERAAIPPSPELLNRLKSGEKKSDIIVNYRLFPQDAKDAFEQAVSYWEGIIESSVPIYVQATWSTLDDNVLGSCGPSAYYRDFEHTPHETRYYPVAIAEKITKSEITGPEDPDIIAQFNKTINWYFKNDLNTPDSLYDFITVVMHELAHGLGFTGLFDVVGDVGGYNEFYGNAAAFDLLVTNSLGEQLTDTLIFPNQSPELKDALTSITLYANSPVAVADGNGNFPRLFAPSEWDQGSSIYHLNEISYPPNNPNSLMTPAIGKAEAIHDPGPLTEGIMADIGWKNIYLDFTTLKDIEEIQPLDFNVYIESDYELDTASLFLIYSTDSFQTHIDTIDLVPTKENNLFFAEITPNIEIGTIHYYINAGDIKGQTFRLPTEAPSELYSMRIGPDNQKPVIEYDPIAYYLLSGKKLKITVNAEDNLGIDSVYIHYNINGTTQNSFGLALDSGITYSGYFNFDNITLHDGDIINYNIYARDASVAQNISVNPADSLYSFPVEGIYESVAKYINNFDVSTTDFIISDFNIYTATSFNNRALQSPHPYPSPGENNSEFNFITILKRPIILRENGTMTYDEVVLVEPGKTGSVFGDKDFWDYVIVEGSKDSGNTWLPLIDGYDSRENSIWLTKFNKSIVDGDSKAIGTPDLYISKEIDLLKNGNFSVGDTILIRFRLYSDPFTNGWGWAIDNLRIQQPVSTKITELSPGNIIFFPNPFDAELNLTFEANNKHIDKIQVDFYNIYGQKVQSVQYDDVWGNNSKTIDLKNLTSGMYLVNVWEDGKKVTSRKLIKK